MPLLAPFPPRSPPAPSSWPSGGPRGASQSFQPAGRSKSMLQGHQRQRGPSEQSLHFPPSLAPPGRGCPHGRIPASPAPDSRRGMGRGVSHSICHIPVLEVHPQQDTCPRHSPFPHSTCGFTGHISSLQHEMAKGVYEPGMRDVRRATMCKKHSDFC